MFKYIFILIGSFFVVSHLNGQNKDSISIQNIPIIEILDTRKQISERTFLVDLNTQQDIGSSLQQLSPVYIKNYGPNTLATPSMRGMAANHTAILWKGFNLQSIMNGVMDFSLIPTVFVDELAVEYGGSSALWGSGAIGGSLHLLDKDIRSNPNPFTAHVAATIGSFDQYRFEKRIKTHWNKQRTYLKWNSFYHQAENDFPYRDLASFGTPQKRLENAAVLQYGTQVEIGHRHKKWDYSAWLWSQNSERNIPPSMTEANNNAFQKDASHRIGLDAKGIYEDKVWNIKAAWFYEHIYFENNSIASDSKAHQFLLESSLDWRLHKKHTLNLGWYVSPQIAQADNYTQNPKRTDTALFLAYQSFWNDKFSSNATFRQALSTDGTAPSTFSLSAIYALNKKLQLKAKLNRDFKQATFNDLYWDAPEGFMLLPETSWAQEISLYFNNKNHRISLDLFNIRLKNQILWSPQNMGIWRPENVAKVWSRGIHFNYNTTFNINDKRHIIGQIEYQYIRSTNESDWFDLKGKQLIYTPEHDINMLLSMTLDRIKFNLNQSYTGQVYSSRDNASNSQLKGFFLSSISLEYDPCFLPINATFAVENIWDTEYQTIVWRPMPGRHFRFILKYNF